MILLNVIYKIYVILRVIIELILTIIQNFFKTFGYKEIYINLAFIAQSETEFFFF